MSEEKFVSLSVYESAVKGRQDFRQALEESREALSSSSKEISRLKGEIEALTVAADPTFKSFWDCKETIDALKAENAALRGALEFYANDKSHDFEVNLDCKPMKANGVVLDDSGRKAREALARTPSSFAEESKALQGVVYAAKRAASLNYGLVPYLENALAKLDRCVGGNE